MFAARVALQKVEELQREEVITADILALFTDPKSIVQHLGKSASAESAMTYC